MNGLTMVVHENKENKGSTTKLDGEYTWDLSRSIMSERSESAVTMYLDDRNYPN